MLIQPSFRDDAASKGLRLSNQALENAILINKLKSEVGVIAFVLSHVTEATGALQWLSKEVTAQTISATS